MQDLTPPTQRGVEAYLRLAHESGCACREDHDARRERSLVSTRIQPLGRQRRVAVGREPELRLFQVLADDSRHA